MPFVVSRDGTKIVYDQTGRGPAVILLNGAIAYRAFYGGKDLAALLAPDFTFIDYDRRGRGESSDTLPYAVDREIEDIDALIEKVGGSAYLYGVSSGAALALLASVKLGPARVKKLAMYEPPYGSSDEKEKREFAEQKKRLNELIARGKPGEAVAFFIAGMGTPPEAIEKMRKAPDWKIMEKVEHTLSYDYAVMGDGSIPLDIARAVTVPALVLDGGQSFEFMHEAADTLGREIPGAIRKTLEDQTHEVTPDVIAPVLREFFSLP